MEGASSPGALFFWLTSSVSKCLRDFCANVGIVRDVDRKTFFVALLARGAVVSACAADYEAQPGKTCLTAPPSCAANEVCQDAPSGPMCACKPGFGGPTCAIECPAGTQDNDRNSTCTATCAAQACGAHARCDDASGTRTCTCAPGYSDAKSPGTCAFVGIINDPGFSNTPPASWKLTGAVLDANYASGVDPGQVTLDAPTTCAGSGQVRQSFTMPTVAESGPLALRAVDRLFTVSPPVGCTFFCFPFAVHRMFLRNGASFLGAINDFTVTSAPSGGAFHDRSVCLGERWYGRAIDFGLSPVSSCSGFSGTWSRSIDHLSIDEAPNCPMPGTIKNGDFEAAGGWTPSNVTGSTADVVAGAGNGGSRAGRITASTYCNSATLTGLISPPESRLPNLAISFDYKLTSQDSVTVRLGGQAVARVKGNGAYQNAHICIPESTKGISTDLAFALVEKLSPTNTCDGTTNREFLVDGVEFVSDSKCGMPATLANPGFEPTDVVDDWSASSDVANSTPISLEKPGFNSNAAASLNVIATCQSSSVTALGSVPLPGAGKGIALSAMIKGSLTGAAKVTTNLGVGSFAVTGAYTRAQVCLAAGNLGVTTPLTIALTQDPNGGKCDVTAVSSVQVDDLRFVEDSACPH